MALLQKSLWHSVTQRRSKCWVVSTSNLLWMPMATHGYGRQSRLPKVFKGPMIAGQVMGVRKYYRMGSWDGHSLRIPVLLDFSRSWYSVLDYCWRWSPLATEPVRWKTSAGQHLLDLAMQRWIRHLLVIVHLRNDQVGHKPPTHQLL